MSWAGFDDHLHCDPRRYSAGLDGIGLLALARTWSADVMTDGVIPRVVALDIAGGQTELIDRLVSAGLWAEGAEGGYVDVDFLDANPTAAEVVEKRAVTHAQRVAAGLARAKGAPRTGGRFTSASPAPDQRTAGTTSDSPATHQPPSPSPSQAPPQVTEKLNPAAARPGSSAFEEDEDQDEDGPVTDVARWFDLQGLLDDPTRTGIREMVHVYDIDDAKPVIAQLNVMKSRRKTQGRSGPEILAYLCASNGGHNGSMVERALNDEIHVQTLEEQEAAGP